MTLDELPPRWRLAADELGRGAFEAPWSAASWTSVVRRSAVLTGFVLYGVVTGNLDTAVFAAFGALQLGLGEAALPWRGLLRFLVVQVAALSVVVFVASSLSSTWWTVPLLAVLAFVQGSTAGVGLVPRATAIGALALGVIFAGLTGVDPFTAAVWLSLGAAAQALLWLVFWRRERDLSVRRALANALRMVSRLGESPSVSGSVLNEASAQLDQARALIATSGFRQAVQAVAVADAIDEVRRTTVCWRVLRQPGTADRLAMLEALRSQVRSLDESVVAPRRIPDLGDGLGWAITERLQDTVAILHDRISDLRTAQKAPAAGARAGLPGPGNAPVSDWADWHGLRPGSAEFRHGIRMAVAIAIAQVVSLLVPFGHSFWVPLTVVFVVKPEWSFTVVRSSARVLGNLAAVILIPPAFQLVSGNGVVMAALVAVVGAVAFRYFSGNYIAASFGVAGTILILDQALDPGASLYAWRIAATVIGACIGLAVSAAIPSWRGRQAPRLLAELAGGLATWQRAVLAGVQNPASSDFAALRSVGEAERNNLIRLRPTVAAAMLEPHPRVDPRALLVATNAAEKAHLSLMALTIETRIRRDTGEPGLDVAQSAAATHVALTEAARCLGAPIPPEGPPSSVVAQPPAPGDDEAAAIVLESARLHQTSADFAVAASWVADAAQ